MSALPNQWNTQYQQEDFMEQNIIKEAPIYPLNTRPNFQPPRLNIMNPTIPPNTPYNPYYNNYYTVPFTVPPQMAYQQAYPNPSNILYYPNNAVQYYHVAQQPPNSALVPPIITPRAVIDNNNNKENSNNNNVKMNDNSTNDKIIGEENINNPIIGMPSFSSIQPTLSMHPTVQPYPFVPNYSNFASLPFNPTTGQPSFDPLIIPSTMPSALGGNPNFNGVGVGVGNNSALTTPVGSVANVSIFGGVALSTGNVSNSTSMPIALNNNNNISSSTANPTTNVNDNTKDNNLNDNSTKNDKTSNTTSNTTSSAQQTTNTTQTTQQEKENQNTNSVTNNNSNNNNVSTNNSHTNEKKDNDIMVGLQTLQTGIGAPVSKTLSTQTNGNPQTNQGIENLSLEIGDLTIREEKDNCIMSFDSTGRILSTSDNAAGNYLFSNSNGDFHDDMLTSPASFNRHLNSHIQPHNLIQTTANMQLIPHYVPMNQFNPLGPNPILVPQFADVQPMDPLYTFPMNHGNEMMMHNYNYNQNYAPNYNRRNFHRNQYQNMRRNYGNNKRVVNNTRSNKNDLNNEDMFSIGDEAILGRHVVTIVSLDWQLEEATVRLHYDNTQKIVSIQQLRPRVRKNLFRTAGETNTDSKTENNQKNNNPNSRNGVTTDNGNTNADQKNNENNDNNKCINNNDEKDSKLTANENSNLENKEEQKNNSTQTNDSNVVTLRTKNIKLSDETMMKLPHLRKHIRYIKSIDTTMGPKDYNQYRVTVRNNGKIEENSGNNNDNNSNYYYNNNEIDNIDNTAIENTTKSSHVYSHDNYINNSDSDYDNQLMNQGDMNYNEDIDENMNNNGRHKRNKQIVSEKGDLFKTELCENWIKKGTCSYGKKCHFAHGFDDIRNRLRVENYKTQPCCDPARLESRLCLFGKRCNYTHPGEPMRRPMSQPYLDADYFEEVLEDYGDEKYPFGIYI